MEHATITIRLPVDLKRAVEEAAASEDRSMTKFIERALRAALEQIDTSKKGRR